VLTFEEFVVESQRAESVDTLCGVLSEAFRDRGYENLVVANVSNSRLSDIPFALFPEGYVEYYMENQCDLLDPVLERCRSAQRPFYWSDVKDRRALTKQQEHFFGECEQIGVRGGLTVPIHGPFGQLALVSASRRSDADEDRLRLPLLAGMCTQFWARWTEIDENDLPVSHADEKIRLTNREIECLQWCKAGKSAWEISCILGVSEKTAQFHISNVMAKLGATNRITAVVMALQCGILDL